MAAPSLRRGHDLRGRRVPVLNFPERSLLVVAGVPGAGKTTLLERLFPRPGVRLHDSGVRLLDSGQAREELRPYLGALPYRYWRPVVHVAHYVRLWRALRGGESIVVHESGTRAWARKLITAFAGRAGRRTHLLLLDVAPEEALAGQEARRRKVRRSSFATHCRRWERLLGAVADPGDPIHGEVATITVIDRAAATALTAIHFDGLHLVDTAPATHAAPLIPATLAVPPVPTAFTAQLVPAALAVPLVADAPAAPFAPAA